MQPLLPNRNESQLTPLCKSKTIASFEINHKQMISILECTECVTCAKGSIYLNDARTNLFAELLQTIMRSPVIERYARRLPNKTDECCQCLYPCDCVIYCSKCPALGLKGVYFLPGNGCHGNLINCLGDCS